MEQNKPTEENNVDEKQRLIAKIRHAGVLGIAFGLITMVLAVTLVFLIDLPLVNALPGIIVGAVLLILGYLIKVNPENGRKILRFLFAFSIIASLLSYLLTSRGPGFLIIIYIFISYGAWKAAEDLERLSK